MDVKKNKIIKVPRKANYMYHSCQVVFLLHYSYKLKDICLYSKL